MSSSDFVPRPDNVFHLWQGGLVNYTEQNGAKWGIPENDFEAVKTSQSFWTVSYSKASNKQNRTAADVVSKDEARVDYEKVLRNFTAQWLSNNAKVSDSDRTIMGLTVKTGTRTSTPTPTTSPIATIDFSVRQQHTIHFFDEASAHSNAKPEGIHGSEIYMKIDGEAPKDVSELAYVGTCTAAPYTVKFDGNKAGKVVYYWLRWVNTRGECGPWSVTVSAMVAG